jgi:hypothetical protein
LLGQTNFEADVRRLGISDQGPKQRDEGLVRGFVTDAPGRRNGSCGGSRLASGAPDPYGPGGIRFRFAGGSGVRSRGTLGPRMRDRIRRCVKVPRAGNVTDERRSRNWLAHVWQASR